MFSGSTVHIRAGDGVRSHQTSAEVPPALKDSVSVSFRHGVLEVTYRERPDEQELRHTDNNCLRGLVIRPFLFWIRKITLNNSSG